MVWSQVLAEDYCFVASSETLSAAAPSRKKWGTPGPDNDLTAIRQKFHRKSALPTTTTDCVSCAFGVRQPHYWERLSLPPNCLLSVRSNKLRSRPDTVAWYLWLYFSGRSCQSSHTLHHRRWFRHQCEVGLVMCAAGTGLKAIILTCIS